MIVLIPKLVQDNSYFIHLFITIEYFFDYFNIYNSHMHDTFYMDTFHRKPA